MREYDQLQTLATSYLPSAHPGGPLSSVLEAFAEGRDLQRADIDALVESEISSQSTKDEFLDFVIYCAQEMLSDHLLSDAELGLIRYLKRLFRIEEGEFIERKREDVAALLRVEVQRILEDRRVDPDEGLHKVDLQSLFDLGYDEFTELVQPEIHEVLLHLVRELDTDQDGLVSEEELLWYHRQVLALDTVIDLSETPGSGGAAPGYLYVLVNPSMDGMVKVGKTTRNPALRAQELSSVTGVPTPFLLVFERFFADCDKAEQLVHDALEARGQRISDSREFFRVPPSQAIELILDISDSLAPL